MADFPGATVISNIPNQGAGKIAFEDWLQATKQLPGGLPSATLTIDGDQVTPTRFFHKIDTQGGGTADDLKQIIQTVMPDGSLLMLSIVSAARVVRIWNAAGGAGQIVLKTGGDVVLADPSHYLLLRRNAAVWEEVERFPRADFAPMNSQNSNYTLKSSDRGRHLASLGNDWTLSLLSIANAGVGFDFQFTNRTQGIVTVDPNGAETIDESSTIKVHPYEAFHMVADNNLGWHTISRSLKRTPRGHLFGCSLSNDGTDPTNDLVIAEGEASSDNSNREDRVMMEITSSIIKRLDANWSAGTNAGGRISTESLVDGTWHVLLFRLLNGGYDICFSQSLAPATLPSSGTHKRRIGSILREGGSIVAFFQDGDYFRRKAGVLDVNATNPGTAAVSRQLSVPSGIEVFAFGNVALSSTAVGTAVYLSDLEATDQIADANPIVGSVISNTSAAGRGEFHTRTNTNRQIRTRLASSDANTNIQMTTLGWYDSRGRVR